MEPGQRQVVNPADTFMGVRPKLNEQTLRVISDSFGFHAMTPVQSAVLPLFLCNKDVAVEACTGSGKTLAFLIPVFELLLKRPEKWRKHEVGALILSPTRELASQIHQVAAPFVQRPKGKNESEHTFSKDRLPFRALLLIGGTALNVDEAIFQADGGNIVIGTPGRVEDFINRVKSFGCKSLEVLVLDEADRLLDMGFEAQINSILSVLPKQRRTGLFSATLTDQVQALMKAGLRNPVKVQVRVETGASTQSQRQATPLNLSNHYLLVEDDQKMSELVHFLGEKKDTKTMIFFLTCACVDYFAAVLPKLKKLKDIHVTSLHGKMKPKKRSQTYAEFVSQSSGVLLCSDLAARGLDVADVEWILQYDAPQDPSFFVHRVGRTARMGRTGQSLIFLNPSEEAYVDFLQIRKVPITKKDMQEHLPIIEEVRKLAQADRVILELGSRAFVSFVRGYKEHHCQYIFRFNKLDFGKLATGFALLQVPKIAETKGKKINFKPLGIETSKIKFKDKQREKQRQENLKTLHTRKQAQRDKAELKKKEKEAKIREEREEKKRKKSSAVIIHSFDEGDWDELANEARLMKKLKKGKITEDEFRAAIGDMDDDEI